MNPGAPEGNVDPAPLVTPVVLLLNDTNIRYFFLFFTCQRIIKIQYRYIKVHLQLYYNIDA